MCGSGVCACVQGRVHVYVRTSDFFGALCSHPLVVDISDLALLARG